MTGADVKWRDDVMSGDEEICLLSRLLSIECVF